MASSVAIHVSSVRTAAAPRSARVAAGRRVAAPLPTTPTARHGAAAPRPGATARRAAPAARRAATLVRASGDAAAEPKRIKLGVVGGSNLTDSKLFEKLTRRLVETKYGDVTIYDCDKDDAEQIAFVRRHYAQPDER